MSDAYVDPAEEPVETAQDAVEPTEPASPEAAPFDGEFDADRARRTIDHLRDRERELEKQAKQFERLQNDPEAFREFVSAQGYEIPEDEPDDEPVAPTFHDPRVDQLLAEREQERLNQLVMEHAAKDVEEIQTELGRKLSEKELKNLGELAIPDENGIPRVSLAWQRLNDLRADWQKDWIEGKKTPSTPPTGSQGSEKFDIRDPDQRIARFVAAMERNSGE